MGRSLRSKTALEFAFVALLAFVLFLGFFDSTWPSIFQARDFRRTEELLRGHPIFFGPEQTGGGNLPGGFYYLLLAAPLALGGWEAAWCWMVLLAALSAAVLWIFARKNFGLSCAVLVLAIYVSSPMLGATIRIFFNPSFVPLFVSLTLVAFAHSFTEKRIQGAWIAACFLLGLAAQLHSSAHFLLLGGLLLQGMAPRLGLKRVPRRELWLGLAAFLLPLLPYMLASGLGQPKAPGAGSGRDSFFLFASYFLYGGAWRSFFKRPGSLQWGAISWVLPWMGILAASVLLLLRRKERASSKGFGPQCRVIFAVCSGMALLPNLLTGFPPMTFQLGTVFAQTFSLFLGILPFCGHRKQARSSLVLTVIVGIVIGAVELGRAQRAWAELHLLGLDDCRKLAELVHARTGWSYEEARYRLYFLNAHVDTTPEFVYRAFERAPVTNQASGIDGYFVSSGTEVELAGADWMITDGIRNHSLELRAPERAGKLILIPYHVTDRNQLPAFFHNLGAPYEDPSARIERLTKEAGWQRFQFNDCPSGASFCQNSIFARLNRVNAGEAELEVQALGSSISQPSEWESPLWTEALIRPFVETSCGAKSTRFQIADLLGRAPDPSLFAPLQRSFRFSCRGPMTIRAAGYESSWVWKFGVATRGPGRSQTP
jgi:hypothetical protein